MSRELDELLDRYSTLLAEQKSSHDAPHISWVGAREILRRAISEAYELGRYALEQVNNKVIPAIITPSVGNDKPDVPA